MRKIWIWPTSAAASFILLVSGLAADSPAPKNPRLLHLVEVVFATGFGGPLSGRVCTALGITADNQSLPVEQISVGVQGNGRSVSASKHRGRLDVIISHRTKEETVVFLASETGELEKALQEKSGQPMHEIPVGTANPEFEKERSWWLDTWLPAHDPAGSRR